MKRIITLLIMFLVTLTSVAALEISINDFDPKPAEAGKAVNVWFEIENPSSDPEDGGYIEIIPKDGLELTPGEDTEKKVGIIGARSSQIVKFRLLVSEDTFKGSHNIEARLKKDGSSLSKKELSIEVTDKDLKEVNLEIGDIESDPTRIKPDDDNVKIVVTIQNIGDGRARGVKAVLKNLPKGITLSESYSGTSLLGNIEADGTSTATFYIDVDKTVNPKEYFGNIEMTYKYKLYEDEDDYIFEEEIVPLQIAVKPVPLYNITLLEISPGKLTAGDDNVKLRITIENIGEEAGESVRLKAYGKTEQPFSFDRSSDFIAPTLDPGEIGQATLEFDIDEDANVQKYYLDIEIKSVVNDDVITYSEKLPITVSYPRPNNPWWLVGIGIIILAGVIVYILLRKRKTTKSPKKVEGTVGKNYLDKMKQKR
ncbi:COG1361 S-layer family protein [Nanoarchaeota archaeon]